MADTVAAPGAQGSPQSKGTNTSTLSEWSGPYVTGMLGKTQALAESPYQTYQGPLTAGPYVFCSLTKCAFFCFCF